MVYVRGQKRGSTVYITDVHLLAMVHIPPFISPSCKHFILPSPATLQEYSNPFATVPRKMRSRVHTRAAGMPRTESDSNFDLQRTKSQLLDPDRSRESTLQRSISADNLDEMVVVEGQRLRDRRTSTEVCALNGKIT